MSGSDVGTEGALLRRQLRRFEERHPQLAIEVVETPDAADDRHQLYVQWLNAGVGYPDVLQLDVVWTPEFAAAGWILPLDRFAPDTSDFFANVLAADRWQGSLYALPWFVDVGMLYWRTDLLDRPPATFTELERMTRDALSRGAVQDGLLLQAARYEGLVTCLVELFGGFGGTILGSGATAGDHTRIGITGTGALAAVRWLRDALDTGLVPRAATTWQEEQTRLRFQSGSALLMRNWPYAWRLMADPTVSAVAGRYAVAPMPAAPGGAPTACLGGARLAINRHSPHAAEAFALLAFLTAPEQMRERAAATGQLPARRSPYVDGTLEALDVVPPRQALAIVERAVPRPRTPAYSDVSRALQVAVHRALTGQAEPDAALAAAATNVEHVLASVAEPPPAHGIGTGTGAPPVLAAGLLLALAAAAAWTARSWRRRSRDVPEAKVAWAMVLPAVLVVAVVAGFPLLWTAWESLHAHDLRTPWRGRPFVGLANYADLLADPRCLGALAHAAIFVVASVSLEMVLGTALALAIERVRRGRGLVRAAVLLPWALPTVVAGLLWRFLFEGSGGLVNQALVTTGAVAEPVVWFGDALLAWVPLVLADVWKTTPFVALLVLAGLQTIDDELLAAARVDGAGAFARLRHVVLPALRPTLIVVLLFRTLDAWRVFGLVYVLTGGGPGTATEVAQLYGFELMLGSLRFGAAAAFAVLVLAIALLLALAYLRVAARGLLGGRTA